ncbi:hypothetical protein HYALB_00002093 [Hymenoscyphus albidus]|uniref:DRBM domain-containing protein n=1 Tax=Hymenoscyphus albidus TaxID=595503 RepID=A0A9N9LD12_9HELO|nr:hypothetical protein HYALB_00002093 [Hymenoscyphus albidus]
MEEQSPLPGKVQLQSMDDFMREGDEREAALLGSQPKGQPAPTKKPKRFIDQEILDEEAIAVKDMGDTNWIGKLNEYRSVHPAATGTGLTYTEHTLPGNPPRFSCAVEIRETPIKFGGNSNVISFANKKAAKHYASKRAIDWLVGNGFMPNYASLKFPKASQPQPKQTAKAPKPQPPPPQQQQSAAAPSTPNKIKYTSQVPDLCNRLGFDVPRYELTKVVENAALWDGYAHFAGDPRIDGPVGMVKGVFGQKNAKEAIAQELVSFLKSIEKHRTEQQEAEEKKRKRESMDSVHEDLAVLAAKAAKTDNKSHATESFE